MSDMTARDRLMLIGVMALVALLGLWFLAITPERKRAASVNAEVETARKQLQSAETQASSAHNAQASYSKAYASLVSLGQAVPATVETASLIYTLDRATHKRDVNFDSITSATAGSSPSGSAAEPASTPAAGFTQQTFTFVFNGSFDRLNRLLHQLENFTVQTPSGPLRVSGRLLTINSVSLTPREAQSGSSGGSQSSGSSKKTELSATITATAYVLPAGETSLDGATPSGPAASGESSSAAPAGSSTSTSTPATPAVVKVTP